MLMVNFYFDGFHYNQLKNEFNKLISDGLENFKCYFYKLLFLKINVKYLINL